MKKLLLLAALAMPLCASASVEWTLQGKTYYADTVRHVKLGPGTTQTELAVSGAQTLHVFYTTTDLTNPYVDIRVTKGSKKYVGCQTLSKQQAAYDRAGARYFVGVNADFFGNSAPIGSTVVDGEVINTNSNNWVNWYMTDDKKPHIATLGYKGTATFPGDATHAVAGINVGRGENQLVIYNKLLNGSNSATNSYGKEVSIEPVEGDLGFSGKSTYKVTCDPVGAGSMAIPANGYVLSGHGTAAALVDALKIGDQVSLDLYPEMVGTKIWQMASGQPKILGDGKVLDTQGALDHLTALNPRTAVGYNADGTKLVLMVVDGRRTGWSAGVVSRVLADIMREVGCTEAMNFDGGGSSEMYSKEFGVLNNPSDGNERAVTNAVWAVCTAEDDQAIAEIRFLDRHAQLPKYGIFEPKIYGYNKYGMLVSTAVTGYKLSCPAELGEVVEDGAALFANGSGTHALTATLGSATATIPVTIGSAQPGMRLDSVVVDSYRDYKAEVVAVVAGEEMKVDNSAFTWSVSDPQIATVDAAGIIHGVTEGTTTVTATVEGMSASLPVKVQIPRKRWTTIDPERDLSKWTVNKTALKAAKITKTGDESFDIDMTVQTTRGTKVTVKPDVETVALPDSIRIAFQPNTTKIKEMTLVAGAPGQRTVSKTYALPAADSQGTYVLTVPVSDFVDHSDFASFPLKFSSVAFAIGNSANETCKISVLGLHTVHTALDPKTNGVDDIAADNATGSAKLYDLKGVEVSGDNAAPGLYIRRSGKTATKVVIR